MQEWIINYTCPDWIYFGRKPRPFGNERHTIACGLSKTMWFADISEGRDIPCEHRRPEFDDIEKTVGTIMSCTRPI